MRSRRPRRSAQTAPLATTGEGSDPSATFRELLAAGTAPSAPDASFAARTASSAPAGGRYRVGQLCRNAHAFAAPGRLFWLIRRAIQLTISANGRQIEWFMAF